MCTLLRIPREGGLHMLGCCITTGVRLAASDIHKHHNANTHLGGAHSVRLLATNSLDGTSTSLEQSSTKEWRTIYHLPLIRIASAFNRLKIYQGALAIGGTPLAFAMEEAGVLPAHVGSVYGAIGVTGLITLTLGSYALRNLIGFIYINDAADKLKFAYLDFWGKRQHVLVNIDDLVPEWEQPKLSRFNIYQAVRLQSDSKQKYKLLQRFGVVTEPETFVTLFGE